MCAMTLLALVPTLLSLSNFPTSGYDLVTLKLNSSVLFISPLTLLNLTSKVEHNLSLYPFAQILILRDFNVHHQLWLSSPFTDLPGELAFNFLIIHDLDQLVQHPTRIPDRLGDTVTRPTFLISSSPLTLLLMLSPFHLRWAPPITISFMYLVLFLQSLRRIPQSEGASGVLPVPAGGT
ncbi:hypothetical protein E2C01_039719 [Portunus trituberculatus]|uniref:Endonuclease/exonuclease/phosphatase domain-containing protein n=1 Tax=Portunus trituberculatus TaxID=210409 RepID=A0A5B7FHR6_PORTR|nr:hypothetical protein [Portunus trituberculatus]